MVKRILPPMNVIAVAHDCIMAGVSFMLALYLRLGARLWQMPLVTVVAYVAVFSALLLAVQLHFRTYRRVWQYTSLNDLLAVARAGLVALALFYGGMFILTRLEYIPRSIPFIHTMTLLFCLSGARIVARIIYDEVARNRLLGRSQKRIPVLLVGMGPQAESFIRESERSVDFPYYAVGIVTADGRQHGREIHGVRVYGGLSELDYVLRKLTRKGRGAQRLLVTDPTLEREESQRILAVAEANHLTLARLPSLAELREGKELQDIRPIAVADILGRVPAVLDRDAMAQFVQGKRVLVTGAGGSIGSELVRQIAAFAPSEILLYELSEFLLYEIDRELAQNYSDLTRHAVIGDVRDAAQLDRYFARFKPDIVFHAAAVKHVPLSESNPEQAVLTNILGSKQVADACLAHGVQAMVQVSTDKAVNPTSVMGASKRVAEIYAQALAQGGAKTRFITVRFGNVLNSAGSVVPLFQQQIANGGPVTVTHRDMLRYFMTIGEATQLILQAAVLGVGQKNAAPIYVLDMGAPVRIEELACQMIRLAGYRPYDDIPIVFTGLRPGEKLFEELFHDEENFLPTQHKSIRLAQARSFNTVQLTAEMNDIIAAARDGRGTELPGMLKQIVTEYQLAQVKAS